MRRKSKRHRGTRVTTGYSVRVTTGYSVRVTKVTDPKNRKRLEGSFKISQWIKEEAAVDRNLQDKVKRGPACQSGFMNSAVFQSYFL